MKSNRRWMMAVVAALVCGAFGASAALVNPSFEDEGEASDRAAGWNRWGHWINRETGWTPTKDGSCLIGYHHWQIEQPDNSGLWQDVTGLVPGSRLTFQVYASADRADAGSQDLKSIELRIETTVHGEQSTVASREWPIDALATGGQWSMLTVETTAPADSVRLLIVVNPANGAGPRGGALKLDAADLVVESQDK